MDTRAILKSKFTALGLALFLVMILVGSFKLFAQKYEVRREINKLQKEASQVETENSRLSELIKYYKTEEYAERAARDKLSLRKEGEYVVSVPQTQDSEKNRTEESDKTNPQKWFSYLFD